MMKNFIKNLIKNNDFKSIFFLSLILIIFLLPLYLQTEKILRDDGAYQAFLRLNGVARYIQKFEIPLWNPNTFCGGKPFYSMYEGPIYNIILYPFMYFADLNNQQQSFYLLIIIPFTLCLFSAAIGSYLFGRYILKFSSLPSFFLGLIYALNPSMVISIISLHNTFIFSYIPWILITVIKFMETRKLKWWILSITAFLLLSTVNNLNYIIRIYFFTGLVCFIYALSAMKKNIKSLVTFLYLISIFIFSAGMVAFMWGGIAEGVSWIGQTGKITFEFIAEEKMNYGNLVSMLIPNFTGLLQGSKAWGEAMFSNTNYIFLGGMFLSFAALISVFFLFKKKTDETKNIFPWILIGFIVLIGTILTMLSDRTPFLKIMSIILPWFFKIPFPHYYHFLQHWSMALLTAIGISLLLKIPDLKVYLKKYIIFIFLVILIIFISVSIFEKSEFQGERLPGYKTIKLLGRSGWFLTQPVLYTVTALILLSAFIFLFKKKEFKYLLIAGIFLETVIFSYIVFYRGDISASAPWDYEPNDKCFASRFKGPQDHPYYQYMLNLKDKIDNNYRYTGTITYIDNFAWINVKYSLFGYDTKPVIKSMYDVMINFMEGYPYQMVPINYPVNFLKNMNVGYIVFKRYGKTKIDMEISNYNNIEYNSIKTADDYTKLEDESAIMNIVDPLPYIYTQNKIKKADLNEQMEKLITQDLKQNAYISNDDQTIIKLQNDDKTANNENGFISLQKKNKILSIDRSYANKLILKIDVQEPALLIRSEVYHKGWKVFIDGKKHNVLRVNFLQQGVWLEKGQHTVVFKFFPESMKYGFITSAFFLLFFIITVILSYYLNRKESDKQA